MNRDRAEELRALFRSHQDRIYLNEPDPIVLEAVLAHGGGYLTGDDICDSLKWTDERYNRALQEVADRLEGTGLQLSSTGWDTYSIVTRLDPADEPLGRSRWLERSLTNRAGLTATEAEQLYRHTPGPDFWSPPADDNQERALRHLQHQGLLVEEPAGLMMSHAVSYSLRLPIETDEDFSDADR